MGAVPFRPLEENPIDMDEQDAIKVVNEELEKLFPGQVHPDEKKITWTASGRPKEEKPHTWTVSGPTEDEHGTDRLAIAVSEVNKALKGWSLYRPDDQGKVYYLNENEGGS